MPALLYFSTEYPFANRAAVYGDGCFTTMAVKTGRVQLLHSHIQRLRQSVRTLNLTISEADWTSLQFNVEETARELQTGIIKIVLSSGMGGRGYARTKDVEPQCYIQTLPPVAHYHAWRQSGISLGISPVKVAKQQELAGVKHLNRLEQVLVKEHQTKCEDDVVLDTDRMIVEVSAGNLFWRACGRWFTPDLIFCGVEGVMRNHIKAVLERHRHAVGVVRSNLRAFNSATDVFICNSLMEIVPVNEIVLSADKTLTFKNPNVAYVTALVDEAISSSSSDTMECE